MCRLSRFAIGVLVAAAPLALFSVSWADQPAVATKPAGEAAALTPDASKPDSSKPAADKTATDKLTVPQKPKPSVTTDDEVSSDLGRIHGEKPRYPRVLFITEKGNTQSDSELARLKHAGADFDTLQSGGWQIGDSADNDIQIVDRSQVPELVQKLKPKEYPAVCCINHKKIVRSFKSGCTTPLDLWTFNWLAKGIDERPTAVVPEAAKVESTGHYPLRGNHWSVSGDWNPTREAVIDHLHGPNHAAKLQADWHIEQWSYEELRSLHDNLHESEPGWQYSSAGGSSNDDHVHKSKGER